MALRRHRTALAVIVLVALIVAGVFVEDWIPHHHLGGGTATTKTATSPPAVSPAPSRSAASPSLAPTASVADPFLGSPAASFADGAVGIIPPAAHAVGAFPAAQVRAAYRKTTLLLAAAGLDPATLRGARPAAFARLLTRQERKSFLGGLGQTGLDRKGFLRSTRAWVASFAPGSVVPAGPVVKVRGRMSGQPAVSSGRHVLQVHADYLFVYPVTSPGQPATLALVVWRVVVNVDFARWDDPAGPLEPWWDNVASGASGILCGFSDGFIRPDYHLSAPQLIQPSGVPVNPYDQQAPPHPRAGCQSITGT